MARRPPDPSEAGAERQAGAGVQDGRELAREICLRQLAVRPRTRAELAATLRKKGIEDDIAEELLSRYDEVGIVDDGAFAKAWVTSRHHSRGLAGRALAGELRRKGVPSEEVGAALEQLDEDTEEATARSLVARRLKTERRGETERRGGPRDDAATLRRLVGMLARKGYPPGLAIRVVKEALAADPGTAAFADQIDVEALVSAIDPAGEAHSG